MRHDIETVEGLPEVVPPCELKRDPVSGFVLLSLRLVLADFMVNQSGGDAAVRKPW